MNGMPQADEVAKLRRVVSEAEEAVARRTGELVAAVIRVGHLDLPKPVSEALTRLELADGAAGAARDRLEEAKRAALTPDERDARRYFSRISALVAAHVVGSKLAKDGNDLHPWRVVERNGKRRQVPNYATEVASASTAERMLDGKQGTRYGRYLSDLFACDFHRIATANSYARCCAMLYAVGVDPEAEPPVIAQ